MNHDPAAGSPGPHPRIPDPSRTHATRTYDYFLGGKENLAIDRRQVEQNLEVMPEAALRVRAQREFLQRAVAYLAREVGLRQFLDIGCGSPQVRMPNVHEIAHSVSAECRVAYVDNNPVAISHMDALHCDGESTVALHGDIRRIEAILDHPTVRRTIDLGRPAGVLLSGIIHFIAEEDYPAAVLARLRTALVPGSHVVVTHISADLDSRVHDVVDVFAGSETPMTQRSRAEIEEIIEGFQPVLPGLVPVSDWHPGDEPAIESDTFGVVARRP